jgi:cysteine desulfurase
MESDVIYLDHAATTPVDPRVVEAMLPYYTDRFGNPSSIYQLGQEGRAAIDRARASVARILGVGSGEIVFTSGATESDNLAVAGVAWQSRLIHPAGQWPHIVTTATEHHAVLHAARWLEQLGFGVTYVGCDQEGLIDPAAVGAAIRPETCLVSVIYANNEVGAVQPVAAIGQLARERGIPFHVDGTQAPGLLPLHMGPLNIDLLSLSAHKFYGPKGVGLLAVRKGTPIAYQQHGGGQEGGRRGGTENVAGIVGLAAALELAEAGRNAYVEHCRGLRDLLSAGLTGRITGVRRNGPANEPDRLPNNLNVSVEGVQGETMLLSLDMQGMAASAGSACTTGNSEPSHVLLAMGLTEADARSSLRFTVGRTNTAGQVDEAVELLVQTVERLRSMVANRP